MFLTLSYNILFSFSKENKTIKFKKHNKSKYNLNLKLIKMAQVLSSKIHGSSVAYISGTHR